MVKHEGNNVEPTVKLPELESLLNFLKLVFFVLYSSCCMRSFFRATLLGLKFTCTYINWNLALFAGVNNVVCCVCSVDSRYSLCQDSLVVARVVDSRPKGTVVDAPFPHSPWVLYLNSLPHVVQHCLLNLLRSSRQIDTWVNVSIEGEDSYTSLIRICCIVVI